MLSPPAAASPGAQIALFPVFPAQADIFVVGAQNHLLPLLEDLAVLVKAGVAGGLFAAPADGFDRSELVLLNICFKASSVI